MRRRRGTCRRWLTYSQRHHGKEATGGLHIVSGNGLKDALLEGAQVNHGRRRLIAALVAVWNKARKSEASTGIMRQGSEPTRVKTVWPQTY